MKQKLHYHIILSILSLLFIIILLSCGKLPDGYVSETADPLVCKHKLAEWRTLSIATCVREGKRVRECPECRIIETERIEKEPHDLVACKTVPATCTTGGYVMYICECGYTQNNDHVGPKGHVNVAEMTVEKTCYSDGYTHYQCKNCTHNYDADIIPASHEFATTVTYPTATKSGYSTHSCTDCPYNYDNNFIKYKDILPTPYLESSQPLCKGIDIYEGEHRTLLSPDGQKEYLPINWERIKAQGYEFVILKVGSNYSGKSPTFDIDYEGAKAAGLGVGAYYYAYSSTVADTIKDAQSVLEWIKGKQFEYPIYYDLEDATLEAVPQSTLINMTTAFIEELQANGYYAGLYVNNEWLFNILDPETILDRFDIWYARYPLTENPMWNESKYGKQLSMWQFSQEGIVDGFRDEIDLNYCYRDYPALMKKWGLNGFEKEST